MPVNVLSFGEVLWDIIDGSYCIGGAPLNFAGHMARLGADSYVLSAVGRDSLGENALDYLGKQNINNSLITTNNFPTGSVLVTLEEGIPEYDIVQGAAWDSISLDDKTINKLNSINWDVIYLGSLAQRSEKSRESIRWILENIKSGMVFFDVNLRQNWFSRDIIEESLKYSTVLKLNDEEVPVISELLFQKDMPPELLARKIIDHYSVSIVIVTCGGEGALFFNTGREYLLKPEPAEIVDTVGAGDSFSGAFVYAYLKNGDIDRAGKLALDVAAFVVGQEGALPEYTPELLKKIQLHLT